jgi:hypothetical protein
MISRKILVGAAATAMSAGLVLSGATEANAAPAGPSLSVEASTGLGLAVEAPTAAVPAVHGVIGLIGGGFGKAELLGKGEPGAVVTVEQAGTTVTDTVDAQGLWWVQLPHSIYSLPWEPDARSAQIVQTLDGADSAPVTWTYQLGASS